MGATITKVLLATAVALVYGGAAGAADGIWDMQAVDADGVGTDPRIGGDPLNPDSWVTVEGIALNASSELLDSSMWQVFVQGEPPDSGGIAAWHGAWFYDPNDYPNNPPWPPFPSVQAGDRVQIVGLIAFHNGKVNINTRHSSDPLMLFDVTILEPNVGMPEPKVIPSVADANYFDQTRSGGGESYQAQWCQLDDVWIDSGTWGAGQTLALTDAGGGQVDMFLAGPGDFGDYAMPVGQFSVRGVFDQEDTTSPYHAGYRLWVKTFADFEFPLTVKRNNPGYGTVDLDPAPGDANTPTYPGRTEVTLTAQPNGNKAFKYWRIYDPNHPGDGNYAAIDSNNPITIVMSDAQRVKAKFTCGGGMGPMLPMVLGAMGLVAFARRRWQS